MSLYSNAVKKPVTTILIFVALAIVGIFSAANLATDLYPDIEFKNIMVVTSYSGAGTEDIENNISRPLENSLNSLSNVRHITSSSKEGFSVITIQFDEDTDLDVATNDVRDKLDMVSYILPKEASKPVIMKFSSSDIPIMLLSVEAKQSALGLDKLMEDHVENRLARIPGVGSVNISGVASREIQVYCDRYKLEAYNLTTQSVAQAISASNKNIPVGTLDLGSKSNPIRVQGELTSSDEIKKIVVGSYQGKNVYIEDVARVEDTTGERIQESYVNGERGAIISILKQSDANAVQVANKVKEELPKIQKELPSDVHLGIAMDTSDFIKGSINSLISTIFITLLVVILVVLFFLGRWRATFIIVLTIPVSLIVAFVYLYFTGNTLNIISMSSLSIAIGMVVDDAIVVLENITTHIEKGSFPKQASIFATNEVAISVVASTLTMLAVFLPLTLVGGLTGILFRQLGFIVSIVITISTIAALSLTPMLSSQLLRRKARESKLERIIFNPINKFLDKLSLWYAQSLNTVVRHRTMTVLVAIALFGGSIALGSIIKTEFLPENDNGYISGTIEFAPGTRMEIVRDFGNKFMQELKEKFPQDIQLTNFTVGVPDGDDSRSAVFQSGSNIMNVHICMVPYKQRSMNSKELTHQIRQLLSKYPQVEISTIHSGGQGGGNANVDMEVYGYDIPATTAIAKEFAAKMMQSGVASEASISRKAESPEYRIHFDEEKLALYGLNKTTAAAALNSAVNGTIASYFRENGSEYKIRVRYAPEQREELAAIENILIPTPQGNSVTMGALAKIEEVSMPSEIERKDRERYVKISCTPAPGYAMSEVVAASTKIINEIDKPESIDCQIAGSFENQQKSFHDLGILMILIIILVYIVMAAQFESLSDPFVIILSVPFGFTGVILGLAVTNTPLGAMALIGAIMLVGIVVKNGIVLIDYIRLLRERGMGVIASVVTAGKSRLRPVLMTTATTVLGMVPLALGIGEGGEMWRSMGITVAFGLSVSTLVTLVLIPVVYVSFSGVSFKRRKKRIHKKYLKHQTESIK